MSDPSTFVNSEQKENIVEIDGKQYVQLGEEYQLEKPYQPRRRYAEKTVRGVVVGRGENKTIIPVEEVRKLAALHCSYEQMATYFGCSANTFRDHFRGEVERAREKLKHRLLEAMIENAVTRMHPTMQIWLSRNWLGMDDNREQAQGESVLPWIEEDED
jgi:AraC-like DNA-binding protein